MEGFTGLIIGVALGVGGMFAKEKFFDGKENVTSQNAKNELDALSDENEKLRKRNREAESQVEELVAENDKLRRRAKDIDNDSEDLQDDLTAAKKEIRKLQAQNEELNRTIQDYKAVCANYEEQIAKLKKQ